MKIMGSVTGHDIRHLRNLVSIMKLFILYEQESFRIQNKFCKVITPTLSNFWQEGAGRFQIYTDSALQRSNVWLPQLGLFY